MKAIRFLSILLIFVTLILACDTSVGGGSTSAFVDEEGEKIVIIEGPIDVKVYRTLNAWQTVSGETEIVEINDNSVQALPVELRRENHDFNTFTIQNDGTGTLIITSITLNREDNTMFNLVNFEGHYAFPILVQPGKHLNFHVSSNPSINEDQTADVIIEYCDYTLAVEDFTINFECGDYFIDDWMTFQVGAYGCDINNPGNVFCVAEYFNNDDYDTDDIVDDEPVEMVMRNIDYSDINHLFVLFDVESRTDFNGSHNWLDYEPNWFVSTIKNSVNNIVYSVPTHRYGFSGTSFWGQPIVWAHGFIYVDMGDVSGNDLAKFILQLDDSFDPNSDAHMCNIVIFAAK